MPGEIEVVIPVHNGMEVLDETLRALSRQAGGGVHITVVLNGCEDRSEDVVRAWMPRLADSAKQARILVIGKPSRALALNAAEAGVDRHRIYLDQDAVLGEGALQRIGAALDQGADFVGARAVWRCRSSWVAAAMNAWNEAPYVRNSPVTAGLYAVSRRGRRRWDAWPESVPDDKFARLHFTPPERVRLPDVTYAVDGPADFGGFIAARTRYAKSNTRLAEYAPEFVRRDLSRLAGMEAMLFKPRHWIGAAIFASVEGLALLRARA